MDKTLLVTAAETTLRVVSPGNNADISLIVGSDRLLQELNQQYRGVDATTDVLSFSAGEIDPETAVEYLGDVIISLPRAEEQASMEGHSLADELQLLVAHGVLHLLGYDHLEIAGKKRMQAAQDKVMKELGVNIRITL